MSVTVRVWGAVFLTLSACGPLPLESAYDGQRAICGEDSEVFAELLDDCRTRWERDESCAGVAGFEGTLEGVDLRVESDLVISRLDLLQTLDGDLVRDKLEVTGQSPYFEYRFAFKHVGGGVDDPNAPARTVTVGHSIEIVHDDITAATLRLSTGAESDDINGVDGQLTSTLQIEDEQVATFEIEFDEDGEDHVEGCFHALGTKFGLEMEEDPDAP